MTTILPVDIPLLFSLLFQLFLSLSLRIVVCLISYPLKILSAHPLPASPPRNYKRFPVSTLVRSITLRMVIWTLFEYLFLRPMNSFKASLVGRIHLELVRVRARAQSIPHFKSYLELLDRWVTDLDKLLGHRFGYLLWILHNIRDAFVQVEEPTDTTSRPSATVDSSPISPAISSDDSVRSTTVSGSSSFADKSESVTPPTSPVEVLLPFICIISPASPTAPAISCLPPDTSPTPTLLTSDALTLANGEHDEKVRPAPTISEPPQVQRQPLARVLLPSVITKPKSKSMPVLNTPERCIQTSTRTEKENTPPKVQNHDRNRRNKNHHDIPKYYRQDSFMVALKLDVLPIGEGGFGQVFRATGIGGTTIAVKLMPREAPTQEVAITNEVNALKAARGSKWAVELVYFQAVESQALIALTYLPGGDMHSYWESSAYCLGLETARFYIAQLILAIHDLHTRGILHRDIKLENMMLDSHRNLKLVDFGLSQVFDHTSVSEQHYPLFHTLRRLGGDAFPLLWATPHNPHQTDVANGTEGYAPPEVWGHQLHSFGIDYFAMGCAFHMMIAGDPPFEFHAILQDYEYNKICVDKNMNVDAYDFLSKVLAYRPLDRLNVARMKMHPVFHGIDWDVLATGGMEAPSDPRKR